jgi:hypothetical protein
MGEISRLPGEGICKRFADVVPHSKNEGRRKNEREGRIGECSSGRLRRSALAAPTSQLSAGGR